MYMFCCSLRSPKHSIIYAGKPPRTWHPSKKKGSRTKPEGFLQCEKKPTILKNIIVSTTSKDIIPLPGHQESNFVYIYIYIIPLKLKNMWQLTIWVYLYIYIFNTYICIGTSVVTWLGRMAQFVRSMWIIPATVFEDWTTCGWQHLGTGNGVSSDTTPKLFWLSHQMLTLLIIQNPDHDQYWLI